MITNFPSPIYVHCIIRIMVKVTKLYARVLSTLASVSVLYPDPLLLLLLLDSQSIPA